MSFTIVAQAKGDTLIPYKDSNYNNKEFFWVYKNLNDIENVIHNIREDANQLLYIGIGVSLAMMFIGFLLIGKHKYAPFRVY